MHLRTLITYIYIGFKIFPRLIATPPFFFFRGDCLLWDEILESMSETEAEGNQRLRKEGKVGVYQRVEFSSD